MIVIDSLNGYMNAMPEERFLITHLHELFAYLNQKGVVTIMVVAQHGLMVGGMSEIDVSYLADTVLLFRYFEAHGEIHQAVSVFKKRTGLAPADGPGAQDHRGRGRRSGSRWPGSGGS